MAVLKAVAALSVLGLAALVSRLAAWRGADPLRAAAFVALNPLVLVHVVGGAHNDGLTMLLAMLAVAAILSAREALRRRRPRRRDRHQGLRRLPRPLRPPRHRDPRLMGRKYAYMEGNRPIGRLLAGAALAAAVAIGVAAYLAFGWDWLHALRAGRREPEPDQPPEHPDHGRPPHRPRPGRRPPRRRSSSSLALFA